MRKTPLFGLVFLVGLVGCGGGGGLDGFPDSSGSKAEMQFWAPSASAASIYSTSLLPLILAGLNQQTPACPSQTMDGTTTTYTGGCTDSSGQAWFGSAVATAGDPTAGNQGPAHIEYDGFGFTADVSSCTGKRGTETWNGTVDQTGDASSLSFSVSMTLDADTFDGKNGCVALSDSYGIDYTGSVAISGPSNMQVQSFAGSGQVGTQSHGKVDASTDSEVVDSNTCSHEAMSGTTTIHAGGHTAVITYDGATSCDTTSTVTWSYDGADQGELAGVSCNAGGGASGGASALLVIGAVTLARRRRRRR